MRNKNNFSQLIKEELVSRFQDVVKNEINEYKNNHSQTTLKFLSLEKEISELRKKIDLFDEKNSQKITSIHENFEDKRSNLISEFDEQRRMIRSSVNEIKNYMDKVNDLIKDVVKLEDLSNIIKKINQEILQIKVEFFSDKNKIISLIEDAKSEVKKCFNNEIEKRHEKIDFLKSYVDGMMQKFEDCKNTNESFLREITIYKKSIFIIEKKIENIYTLIERFKGEN